MDFYSVAQAILELTNYVVQAGPKAVITRIRGMCIVPRFTRDLFGLRSDQGVPSLDPQIF